MKRIIYIMALAMLPWASHAQTVILDHEAPGTTNTFTYFGNCFLDGTPTGVVSNPDATGLNTSSTVGEFIRTGCSTTFAGCFGDPAPSTPVDLTTDNIIKVKVYFDHVGTFNLKLEGSTTGSPNWLQSQLVTDINQWVQLEFNTTLASEEPPFNTAVGNSFSQVVLFVDLGAAASGTDDTTYYDDIVTDFVMMTSPIDLPITWDDAGIDYTVTDFGGAVSTLAVDPTDGANTVMSSNKPATAEFFAGTTMSTPAGLASPIALSNSDTRMSVRVYSPDAGIPVRLKVEDAADPTKSVEAEVTTTVANAWETLIFDFADEVPGTAALNIAYTYNKASIFFNFSVPGSVAGDKTYLWDDVEFIGGGGTGIVGNDLPITFDDPMVDYTAIDFGGAITALVPDPLDPANTVTNFFKPSTAEFFAGSTMSGSAGLATPVALGVVDSIITVRVYSPQVGIQVKLKLEDNTNPTLSVETDAFTTVANAWETLVFNFNNESPGTAALNPANVYDKISIFMDFGNAGAVFGDQTYFYDDVIFGTPATACTEVAINIAGGAFPSEISWFLIDDVTGDTVASAACGSILGDTAFTACLNPGQTYTFNAFDDYGDGWNGGSWSVTEIIGGCEIAGGFADDGIVGDNTFDCIGFSLEETASIDLAAPIAGCTDPAGINYNPCATIDDGSCVLPAPNDDCANAIDIPSGTCYVGSNVGATFGGDSLDAACVDGSLTPADIWFTTTVPAGGAINITLPATPGFSSIFELYSGSCGALGSGILAGLGACNNYAAGGGITLSGLTPGAVLYIRYWDFGSDQEGPIEICVEAAGGGCTDICATNYDSTALFDDGSCLLPTPDAVDCSSAATIVAGVTSFYIAEDTSGVDISSCAFNDVNAAWFAYAVPTGLDTLDIYTCGSSFDTGLSLWDACGGTEIVCNDDGTPAGGSSCGGASFQSYIQLTDSTLDAYEGSTIYIRISGFNNQFGCGELNIEEVVTPFVVCNPPTGLTHTDGPGAGVTTLSWDAVAGAQGYRIQGGPVAKPVFKRQSVLNSNKVPTDCGADYVYRVRVLCADGSKSGYSAAYNFTTDCGARMGNLPTAEIFPNPATESALVQFETTVEEDVLIELVDITGKIVSARTMTAVNGTNQHSFDVSNMVAGTYFVQISGEETVFAMQLVVTH